MLSVYPDYINIVTVAEQDSRGLIARIIENEAEKQDAIVAVKLFRHS